MTSEDITKIDHSGMLALLRDFPNQVREALVIGENTDLHLRTAGIHTIVICGLGGSAIGGDLLRSYLANDLTVPFIVNRHYTLPRFVGPDTLVIISSYSGNTEETTTAHREALRRKARLLCVSSDGLTEQLARRAHSPFIKVPGGLPPRAALGYSFFPLLLALTRLGFVKSRQKDIAETVDLLDEHAQRYAGLEPATNPALALAQKLHHRIAVCYSATERFDAVNTRWRGQIAENAKALTFGNVLPEMNHNELVGWKVLENEMREMVVIFLRDKDDHKRVQIRMDLTREIISRYTGHIEEVWSQGKSVLARMFSLIQLGDWVSFYLAILHGEDPTPVAVIDYLKQSLAQKVVRVQDYP
jgi:glucose/mannose-6-phosphate isomerase